MKDSNPSPRCSCSHHGITRQSLLDKPFTFRSCKEVMHQKDFWRSPATKGGKISKKFGKKSHVVVVVVVVVVVAVVVVTVIS